MKKIAFFYRNDEDMIAFSELAAVLFRLWSLESLLIKHVLAGSCKVAGEFALRDFLKSDRHLFITTDDIEVPENFPHISFAKDDDFSGFLKKIAAWEEATTM